MKACTKCGTKKKDDEFSFKNKLTGVKQSWCKNCLKQANRKHYESNKKEYLSRSKAFREQRKEKLFRAIFAYFEEHPCVDCGESDPVVLQFDHRRDKKYTLANMIRDKKPIADVFREIEKCDVRCANCHSRKTSKERGWYKFLG